MRLRRYLPMTEGEVWKFLEEQRVMSVATVNEDGTPHNTPVWFLPHGGKIYFRAQPYKRKIRNLKSNPWVSCTVEAGRVYPELRGVSILARARIVEEADAKERLNRLLVERYREERRYELMPEEWRRKFEGEERVLVELSPVKVYSWDNRKWLELKAKAR